MKPTLTLLCALVIALYSSAPAVAALGGDIASVETDRVSMKGAQSVTSGIGYSVHEIQTAAGMVIHEYVSAQGKVFAVSWRGPGCQIRSKLPRCVDAEPLPRTAFVARVRGLRIQYRVQSEHKLIAHPGLPKGGLLWQRSSAC